MNPFGKSIKGFLTSRGYTYKSDFWKFLPDRSLLVEVSFRTIKPAFGDSRSVGYTVALEVYYPVHDHFILISPAEIADVRRDGTLRHVVYTTEEDGIYRKTEGELVYSVLSTWFDFWEEKLTTPRYALEAIDALRGRAPFPDYLSYLTRFVASDEQDKLRFEMEREACVWPFDGGINFTAYVAYMTAGGMFAEATRLVERASDPCFFENVRHASAKLGEDRDFRKIAEDASRMKIVLSESNVRELSDLGLIK